MLQACVCVVVDGHDAPPYAATCVTVNARDCIPLPHGTLHAPQLLHVPSQSTGHGSVLHVPDSDAPSDAAHVPMLPPSAAGVTT